MLAEPIQFQTSPRERDFIVVFPHQLLCIRQTAASLEFLRAKPNGGTSVVCVEGSNLGVLRRELVNGARSAIGVGLQGPPWGKCFVRRIVSRMGWTISTDRLALDPNPTPDRMVQLETGMVRDLWLRDSLEIFSVPRGRADCDRFLLQFRNHHAYVMRTTAFSKMLADLRGSNFRPGTLNRFSIFANNPYPPCPMIVVQRHVLSRIEYFERNLAARGEWDVVLDFRHPPSPAATAMSLQI